LGSASGAPVSRIAVNNLFIEKFERFGVQLDNANNVRVDNNIIRNATALDGGGQGYGILISGYDSYNNWISNNTIGPVIRHAVLIQGAHHNLVEYNRITGTVSGAIDLHGEDEYANEIRYNVISDGVRNGTTISPNGAGIEVGEFSGVAGTTTMHDNSGPGNYIHHNTVYNYSYGFRIMNNSNYTFVEDNVFYNNDEAGILANLAPLNNLYIARNQVYDNGHGILLYGVTDAFVTDNIVQNNTGIGIGIDPQTYPYVITGNTVTNNGMNVYLGNPYGVYIPGPTSTPSPLALV
jgi:parallel beta-helix repeat protein